MIGELPAIDTGAVTKFDKSFPLDPHVLGAGSALTLHLTASTDADVVTALELDTSFPTRPSGAIDLAHIGLTVTGGKDVAFTAGGTRVGFSFSGGVTAGAGVFDNAADALAALGLPETPGLDLTLPGSATPVRYALLRAAYSAKGSVSGSHPIGALGSVTFGVSGKASGTSAVLHRFSATARARTVLADTVSSWKLPRHASNASALKPSTWLFAEADGSVAVNVAARLGYNFDFVRQAKVLGLSGDIGLKIDAAATATFGFSVSGKYLVVVGRESDNAADTHLRVRLFKLSSNGLHFGLNLTVGVTGVTSILPNKVDDFVKAVFGVHGSQIVRALQNLEQWTDPHTPVGKLVAGLVNEKGRALLHDTTGIDPGPFFDAARHKFLAALNVWNKLPPRVSSELWGLLGNLNDTAATELKGALTQLSSTDPAIQKTALLAILKGNNFESTPAGMLISALADQGLLNLLDRLPDVQHAASTILDVLNNRVIARLQASLARDLDLEKVLSAKDFDTLDSFLLGRLSAFFDKELHVSDLSAVKSTISMVLGKRQEIDAKARKALHSRYGLDLAATWSRTTANTAVLDVVFDTSSEDGKDLLKALLENSDFDSLMTSQSKSIEVNAAILTHEITRKSTLDLALPFFTVSNTSLNEAISTVEEDTSRVLLYNATGTDIVKARHRFTSSLAVTLAASITPENSGQFPDLRIHDGFGTAWSYQLLQAKADMRRGELEAATRPFINQYMAGQFQGGTSLSSFYAQFDRTVQNILGNGPEDLGDVCVSYEVTVPAAAMGAWARPVTDVDSAAKVVSRAIQDALKQIVPFYFFDDITKFDVPAVCYPLLIWAAIPTHTSAWINSEGNLVVDQGKDVFWDHVNHNLRAKMVHLQSTALRLGAMLAPLRLRLKAAGKSTQFFGDELVGSIQNQVFPLNSAPNTLDIQLQGLLAFESAIVHKAASAIRDIQGFLSSAAAGQPSQAVLRLADFAADITTAFNQLAGNTVFGGLALRGLNQMLFVEAARKLDGSWAAGPKALLTLAVLKPAGQRRFDINTFPDGQLPAPADIALSQRLVTS